MAKSNKLFSKVVMYVFLVLIVLGFTVPGFLNSGDTGSYNAPEPRLCRSDADCYLLCDQPRQVLCSMNLCVQNSCEESVYFPYNEEGFPIELNVIIEGSPVNLTWKDEDIFVSYDSHLQVHSNLPLQQILEKAGVIYGNSCVLVAGNQYCEGLGSLRLYVNSEESFLYERYVPKSGDRIELSYSMYGLDEENVTANQHNSVQVMG
jgi:hypothetical protein